MEAIEDNAYAYWLFLKKVKRMQELMTKDLLGEDSYRRNIALSKDDLQLKETFEQLIDLRYQNELEQAYGIDADSCPIPFIQAKEKVRKAANIDPKFVCFSDIVKRRRSEMTPSYALQCWLRSRGTTEYMSLWEKENNPKFNFEEATALVKELESQNSGMTIKKWIARTNAIGITSLQGRYGGTYADPIIAEDFEMWLSPRYRFTAIRGRFLHNEWDNRKLGVL